MLLIYLSPIFILYEMFQLVVAERYIGIKQIRSGVHPMDSETSAPEWLAAGWLIGMFSYWLYMFVLIFNPWGGMQGFVMLFISLLGIALRRTMGLKWALVIMTIEGAIRMGLLANLLISALFYGSMFSRWSL